MFELPGLLLALVSGAAGIGAVIWSLTADRGRRRGLPRVAAGMGIDLTLRKRRGGTLSGSIAGRDFEAWHVQEKRRFLTCVRVAAPGAIPARILVRWHHGETQSGFEPGADLVTGDARFDNALFVHAVDPAAALGLLDLRARERILDLEARQGRLQIGGRHVELRWDAGGESSEALVRRLKHLADLVPLLCRGGSTTDHLLHNLVRELDGPVAQNLLEMLLRRMNDEPQLPARLLAVLDKCAPGVRVAAAAALGEDGVRTLVATIERAQDPAEVRVAAIRALADRQGEGVLAALHEALASIETVCSAAEVLGRRRDPSSTPHLVRAARAIPTAEGRAAALAALAHISDPRASAPLVEIATDPDLDRTLRVAALAALARCGDLAAVEPLLAFASERLARISHCS